MYKITLYDECCSPISDGTAEFFVEDLTEFEKNWVPIESVKNVTNVEDYYRSKHGEVVSTYYDDPKKNMVQEADGGIVSEKSFSYKDKTIVVPNAYLWESTYLFDELSIRLAAIKFRNRYILCGQYFCKGCCREQKIWNRWYDKETNYTQIEVWGNSVVIHEKRYPDWDALKSGRADAYKDFSTNDRSFFKEETISTFVWIPIRYVQEGYEITEPTEQDIARLMCDLPGEAG